MLFFKNRLLKKKDFEKVFQKGKGFKRDFIYLKFVNNNLNYSRFGFVISKKVSKKAVFRNKIKRQLRHAVKNFISKIKKNKDIVIIILYQPKELKNLNSLLEKFFQEIKIYD